MKQKPKLSEAEREQLLSYIRDPEIHAKACLKIRDHNTASIAPLLYNDSQKVLHQIAEKQRKEFGGVRILLLKSRRFGGSTYVQGRFYSKTSLQFNRNAFIVAHEREGTNTLFEMAKLMQERNPIAPSIRASNEKTLKFDTDKGTGLKSEYRLASAENVDAGRSQGIHYLHCCLHENALIILADGSTVSAKDIKCGDKVLTGSGAVAPVSKKFDTGIKETFLVDTWLSNEPTAMTADHKVFTIDGVKKCGDLSGGDWVMLPAVNISGEIRDYSFSLPNKHRAQCGGAEHIESATIPLDYDFGYYLGYYLAEGCVKRQNKGERFSAVHFAYHKDEEFIEYAAVFASKFATSRKDTEDDTKRKRTYFHGTYLAHLTENICGRTSKKHIPAWFFKTNAKFLRGVVDGYFDGDGSKTQVRRINAVSTHERIARQLRRVIVALGLGVCSLSVRDNRERYGTPTKKVFVLDANGDTWRKYMGIPSEGRHKATKYQERGGHFYVKIRSIAPAGCAQTFDIEVDHPDHNFETPIGVVSNSEEAFWRDGRTLLTGLLQCVPDPPAEAEIFRESTANGFGNSFQEDCFKAYGEGQSVFYQAELKAVARHMPESEVVFPFAWKAEGQDWVLVFMPWFMHERYTRAFDRPEEKEAFETRVNQKVFDSNELQWVESEAAKLRKQFGLTLEQLYWREWAIENKCNGDVNKFHQEYPASVEEAFLSTGSNVYPKLLCDQLEANCEKPIIIGDLVERAGQIRIRRNEHGKFRMWEKPEKDGQYFICVDSGGGKNERQKAEKKDPDPSCIDVWNHRTGAQAAQWHGHIEYDLIADVAEMAGKLFNRASACVELQNHGYTVVADLKRKKYPMYEWKPDEPGWSTNSKTKPLMVDDLYRMSRDGLLHIRSKQSVSEMRTFIEENGKYNAASGCHDERVDTAGMASQMMQVLPSRLNEDVADVVFGNIADRAKPEKSGYAEVYAA